MKELAVQKRIVDDCKDGGGFGWKNNNQFLVGVPDLTLIYPGYKVCIPEVKLGAYRTTGYWNFNATPLQKKFMQDIRSSGGFTGIIVACGQDLKTMVLIWVSDLELTRIPADYVLALDNVTKQRRNNINPVFNLLERATTNAERPFT